MRLFYFLPGGGGYDGSVASRPGVIPFCRHAIGKRSIWVLVVLSSGTFGPGKIVASRRIVESIGQARGANRPIGVGCFSVNRLTQEKTVRSDSGSLGLDPEFGP
jgi:hypothetical protein